MTPPHAEDPTGWFEALYAAAERGEAVVPWDRQAPQQLLVDWAAERGLDGTGRKAVVVGAGYGRDAEFIARFGYRTVAFDVSPTAIQAALRRFPGSPVRYAIADVLDPPAEWRGEFDLVVESITVQSLSPALHREAIAHIGRLVAPNGTLIVIAAARDDGEPVEGPPWPLTRAEVEAFADGDLRGVRIEQFSDAAEPGVRRWRAEFERP
jgi:SAM-dependent methyltransferase